MNEDQRELREAFRTLAADGSRQAPPHIEKRLLTEFRKRMRRRRLVLWSGIAGAGILSAGIALFVGMRLEAPKSVPAPAVQVAAASTDDDAATGFYPLPEAEALPPVENAVVVRVQLPASSLRLMGYPVGEEVAGSAVEADLLLGQDGLARGVRLAQ